MYIFTEVGIAFCVTVIVPEATFVSVYEPDKVPDVHEFLALKE